MRLILRPEDLSASDGHVFNRACETLPESCLPPKWRPPLGLRLSFFMPCPFSTRLSSPHQQLCYALGSLVKTSKYHGSTRLPSLYQHIIIQSGMDWVALSKTPISFFSLGYPIPIFYLLITRLSILLLNTLYIISHRHNALAPVQISINSLSPPSSLPLLLLRLSVCLKSTFNFHQLGSLVEK